MVQTIKVHANNADGEAFIRHYEGLVAENVRLRAALAPFHMADELLATCVSKSGNVQGDAPLWYLGNGRWVTAGDFQCVNAALAAPDKEGE